MKFMDQMNRKEKKQFVREWIERYVKNKHFMDDGDLIKAIEFFNENKFEKAGEYLSKLSRKYIKNIYNDFKKFLERLTIPQDKELEEEIKRAFSLKDAHTANYLMHQAIEEKKIELTEDELKIVQEFARECT